MPTNATVQIRAAQRHIQQGMAALTRCQKLMNQQQTTGSRITRSARSGTTAKRTGGLRRGRRGRKATGTSGATI